MIVEMFFSSSTHRGFVLIVHVSTPVATFVYARHIPYFAAYGDYTSDR